VEHHPPPPLPRPRTATTTPIAIFISSHQGWSGMACGGESRGWGAGARAGAEGGAAAEEVPHEPEGRELLPLGLTSGQQQCDREGEP